jgi:hypothetical protein
MRMPGFVGKNDPICNAERTETDHPSTVDIKAMVKKGFLCGLPLVARHEPESRG